ncbi:MAG: DUF4340 domain-containing protein [Steroidobacter sp.]
MTSRRLLILSIAALIAIGAGVWLANRQSSSGASGEHAALFPELKQQLDAVQNVRIFKAGDVLAVELVRKEGGWTVAERSGYPADEAKLSRLLRSLGDAKLYEEKTSNPESYKSLGVEDVSDAAAAGVRIEISGAPTALNLIVGKAGSGAQAQYVRRAGEAQSWLINSSIDASASPDAWLRKQILDASADRIQSATVKVSGQKPYTAVKNSRADTDFNVEGLPKGKKLSSPSAANGFATALSGLTLADVQPASAFTAASADAGATFSTFDGLVVQLEGWSRDDKRFIAMKPSYDAQLAERFKVATAPSETHADPKADAKTDAPKPTAAAAKAPDIEAEVKTANARVEAWVYEIPSYKYEQIFKPLEQLL